ncbi:hypothetical protein N327_09881, partial [Fulmarus glacialis]
SSDLVRCSFIWSSVVRHIFSRLAWRPEGQEDERKWRGERRKSCPVAVGDPSPTLALISCSMLELTSSSSSLSSLFSFSSFCLTRCRLSICSLSSATLSACFLRSAAAVASCCSVASSRSRRIFWNSASRFLLSSS